MLVTTDVAARGIDIAKLPHVVNYKLLRSSPDYVHWTGRSGLTVSLISREKHNALHRVEKLIGAKIACGRVTGFKNIDIAYLSAVTTPSTIKYDN